MRGGDRGIFLSLRLPVFVNEKSFVEAKTRSFFAYEAEINGVDLIIGYPFLKALNLMVDCGCDHQCFGRPVRHVCVCNLQYAMSGDSSSGHMSTTGTSNQSRVIALTQVSTRDQGSDPLPWTHGQVGELAEMTVDVKSYPVTVDAEGTL